MLNFTHLGLALTGLLTWISYLAAGVTGLAWAACGLLLAAASLGMSLVFLAGPSGDDPRPSGHRPKCYSCACRANWPASREPQTRL